MTEYVGRVRVLLDRIAAQRGRPYPLAVHVPDAPIYCLRCGLDIERWLANDLVDMVVAGTGYRTFCNTYSDFIDLCHSHGIPICLSANCGVLAPCSTLDRGHVLERFRGLVGSMWLENPDGIQLFNLFRPPGYLESKHFDGIGDTYAELSNVGDSNKLLGLDKLHEAGMYRTWVDREILSPPAQCPQLVAPEAILVKISDPVERLAHEGCLRQLMLRVRVTDLLEEETVRLALNDVPVLITNRTAESSTDGFTLGAVKIPGGGWWFEAIVDAPPLRQGLNHIRVSPGAGCVGNAATRIRDVQVWVRFRQASEAAEKQGD